MKSKRRENRQERAWEEMMKRKDAKEADDAAAVKFGLFIKSLFGWCEYRELVALRNAIDKELGISLPNAFEKRLWQENQRSEAMRCHRARTGLKLAESAKILNEWGKF